MGCNSQEDWSVSKQSAKEAKFGVVQRAIQFSFLGCYSAQFSHLVTL